MWKKHLDPFIDVIPVDSSVFLQILFSPPNHPKSIHVAVYLPTQGKEKEFMTELSKLISCVELLGDKHPEALLYLRGDFNVNKTTIRESASLITSAMSKIYFLSQFSIRPTIISKEMEHQILILINFSSPALPYFLKNWLQSFVSSTIH